MGILQTCLLIVLDGAEFGYRGALVSSFLFLLFCFLSFPPLSLLPSCFYVACAMGRLRPCQRQRVGRARWVRRRRVASEAAAKALCPPIIEYAKPVEAHPPQRLGHVPQPRLGGRRRQHFHTP